MFGSPSIINRREINAAYDKLSKRKGKVINAAEVNDGDIVRKTDERQIVYTMLMARIEKNGDLTLCRAHDLLYSNAYFATRIPSKEFHKVSYRRVATENEYPQPAREPEITTLVYFNDDGTVCCQNHIHGLAGQHFTLSKEEYLLKKNDEKDIRNWEETNTCCPQCKTGL